MEEYGKILIIATPIFLVLIIIEKLYGIYKKNDTAPLIDSVSSISSGITNSVKDVLGLSLTFISYEWLVSKIALIIWKPTYFLIVLLFLSLIFMAIGAIDGRIRLIFSGTNMPFTTAAKNLTLPAHYASLSQVWLICLHFY